MKIKFKSWNNKIQNVYALNNRQRSNSAQKMRKQLSIGGGKNLYLTLKVV